MRNTLKLLLVAGARPNFMKLAPLVKAAARFNEGPKGGERRIEARIVHTGQHYDAQMSQVFFDELGIPAPDHNLEVGSGSHAAQTAEIMKRFEPVCLEEKPDWVVVVGDVNSTMACTLAEGRNCCRSRPILTSISVAASRAFRPSYGAPDACAARPVNVTSSESRPRSGRSTMSKPAG